MKGRSLAVVRLLSVAAAVLTLSVGAADLYVDATNGVDDETEGRGGEMMPYKTIEYAYSKAADSGDRLLLAAGKHSITNDVASYFSVKKGVTITSKSGNPADVIIKKTKGQLVNLSHTNAVLP